MAYASIISSSALVRGNIRGDGSLQVLGRVEGDITVTGDVSLGSEASVTGSTEGLDAHVGGLAGHNFGTIVRSAATGSVSADAIGEEEDGEIQIGGLVGVNQNLFDDDDGGGLISVASITDSYSTAAVTATVSDDAAANGESDAFVGGLATTVPLARKSGKSHSTISSPLSSSARSGLTGGSGTSATSDFSCVLTERV